MKDTLKFESRSGKLTCTPSDVFGFITDLRNFEQLIPDGKVKNWQASHDSCSFQVPPLGSANVRITEKQPNSLVVFAGDALQKNDFEMFVHISGNDMDRAEVKVILTAVLNPILKMMATGPIGNFLESLVTEMEKFDRWNTVFKEK